MQYASMGSGKDRAGSTDSLFFVHRPFLRTFGRRAALLLGACATLGMGGGTNAQTPTESHAKVELISDGNPGATTKAIWLGLLFHLDQGWHVYWQNAGDSGEPPKVSWNLPPGFRVGAIRWPQPMRLGSGSVVDYGYEDEVLLMARVEQPTGSRAGAAIPIAADVEYVVCREVCIPGKAHLTLTDPATSEASEWRGLFERTRAQLPKAVPGSWKLLATSDKDHFTLSVETGSRVESAAFFPLEPNQIENSARQEFASTENGLRLTLQKSDQLMKPISILRGLVVLGAGHTFEVAVPVAAR